MFLFECQQEQTSLWKEMARTALGQRTSRRLSAALEASTEKLVQDLLEMT